MRDECVDAMVEALGRPLKAAEARDIEDAVRLHMKMLAQADRQAWLALSPQERLEQGAQAAAQALIADLKLKQQRVALQIGAVDRIQNQLDSMAPKLAAGRWAKAKQAFWGTPAEAGLKLRALSELLAFDSAGHGVTSTETWGHTIGRQALGELMDTWKSVKGFSNIFVDKQGVSDLIHELFGEDTGNAAAKAGAAAWFKVTDGLRDRANASGMNIGKLESWRFPQNWSQARIASAGVDQFTNDMLQHLDRSKYLNPDGSSMGDKAMTAMLHHVYDTITSDGMNTQKPGAFQGNGMIANRMSTHRALHFKDADSFLAAHGNYGESSLFPTLVSHINGLSRDVGLVETWGPNSAQTYRYFADKTLLEELRANPTAKARLEHLAALNDSMFDMASGKRDVINQTVADIGQGVRNFETAAKLPKVIFSALGDWAGMAATAFANKVPATEVFMRGLHNLNPANAVDRDIAERNGLGFNRVIGGLNRFAGEDLQMGGGSRAAAFRDFTSKLATTVLNATGQERLWDGRRQGLGSVLQSYLGKTVQQVEHFKDLNVQDHGILATKGITEADWQVWRRAEGEDWGMKHPVLTPKSVWSIPDEQLAELGDPTDLKRHAATSLLGHILEETGMGVMEGGIRQRAGKLLGTAAGTPAGELLHSALLFKTFAFSMTGKHWSRMMSLPSTMAWKYGATLATVGTVMGAMALQLRNLTNGKNPENMASPQFMANAILKGGGLGFYGDFLYDETNSNDTSLAAGLMGPTASDLEQIWKLSAGYGFAKMKGRDTRDEGGKILRFARSETPILNLWYLQAAADHLLWNNMQDWVSPGYLDRMQAKAYGQRGTTWWWNPQEGAPNQGPDIRQAWQPDRGREQLQRIADTVAGNR
jgi:hypothetical protein